MTPINYKTKTMIIAQLLSSYLLAENWVVDTQSSWEFNQSSSQNIEIKESTISASKKNGTYRSILKSFPEKRTATNITLSQVSTWLNWEPIEQLGPSNLLDAPVALRVNEGDYWLFGRYGSVKQQKKNSLSKKSKNSAKIKLRGFDTPLSATSLPNVFDAPGAKNPSLGGYHAWQSKDMKTWVHHGPISTLKGKWLTTAERVGNQTYFYYDFPNDQDPHLIIDDDLTDGKVGKEMGMAFEDPSDGSDCAVIRSRDGKFHLISENWSCINASERSWDSPLANHAISDDGIQNFKLVESAVDYRTEPTGEFATFHHPHWAQEDPDRFPAETTTTNGNGHKAGAKRAVSHYEIHAPEQEAYGDWAAISISGQYYLFGDYDPVGAHGKQHMKTIWFTSDDINKPFKKCSTIGSGHPDPDIIFAENKFWLISQTDDFVSDGPWIDGIDIRVGVDIDNDKKIDQWTEWSRVKETYRGVEGFAKHVDKIPAQLDLTSLPKGYGFQYEILLSGAVGDEPKPELDKVILNFK